MPTEYFEVTVYRCKDCGRIFACYDPKYLPKYHYKIGGIRHVGTFEKGSMEFVSEHRRWEDLSDEEQQQFKPKSEGDLDE